MMWSEVVIERKRGVLLCLFDVQDMSSSESTTAELIGVVTVFLKPLPVAVSPHDITLLS